MDCWELEVVQDVRTNGREGNVRIQSPEQRKELHTDFKGIHDQY